MDIIPKEEKDNWSRELGPVLTEMDKLSNMDKIHGFKSLVIDKYVAHKALNYLTQNLMLVDCDREMLEKENEELKYKLDNFGNYDNNRLKEYLNKVVVVPSTQLEVKERGKQICMRNLSRLKTINDQISKTSI